MHFDWKWLNLALALLIGVVVFGWQQRPRDRVKLVFCAVGQGDATLVIWQDRQILIDGGPNNRVLDCLGRHLPFWDRTIELVIASHAEADHITGLVETVRRYRVKQFLAVNEANNTPEWQALNRILNDRGIPVRELVAGSRVGLGPVRLVWLWPDRPGSEPLAWQAGTDPKVLGAKASLNQLSQVIWFSFGAFDWLLTGDIDTKIEHKLITSGLIPEVEVLKVAHHGSKYSSSQSFVSLVSPELAVIGVGRNNYGHPTPETIARLEAAGAVVKRTDSDGEVVIESDGQNWRLD